MPRTSRQAPIPTPSRGLVVRVQRAYRQLAREPFDWVRLGTLRQQRRLSHVPTTDLTAALLWMERSSPNVHLAMLWDHQLTAADWAVATVNGTKHMIAMAY
jgi:hypothetical protein